MKNLKNKLKVLKENDDVVDVKSSDDLEQDLNIILSNYSVLNQKLYNYHWFANGPKFFQIHEKFEEFYKFLTSSIDELAEQMIILELKPFATLKEYLENTTISEASYDLSIEEMVDDVIEDYIELVDNIETILDDVDVVTEGILIEHLTEFKKTIWMLKSTK